MRSESGLKSHITGVLRERGRPDTEVERAEGVERRGEKLAGQRAGPPAAGLGLPASRTLRE